MHSINITDLANPLFTLSVLPNSLGNYMRPDDDAENSVLRYLALTFCEGLFFLSALIGAVETIFWSAIVLLATPIHFVIPKSNETAASIYTFLFERAGLPCLTTVSATVSIAYNFFTTAKELDAIDDSCIKVVNDGLNVCKGFLDYQLFD